MNVNIVTGSGSFVARLHFCDSAHLASKTDTVPQLAGGPWDFYLPIEMLAFILDILRTEPTRAISYMWSNPGGGGTPIGEISIHG